MSARELAEDIVEAILVDLSGRSGVGNELEAVDNEVYDELEETLTQIVEKKLEHLNIL